MFTGKKREELKVRYFPDTKGCRYHMHQMLDFVLLSFDFNAVEPVERLLVVLQHMYGCTKHKAATSCCYTELSKIVIVFGLC